MQPTTKPSAQATWPVSAINSGQQAAPYNCSGGNTTPDLNDDTKVNIQDLSLVGGNYGITPVPQPWP